MFVCVCGGSLSFQPPPFSPPPPPQRVSAPAPPTPSPLPDPFTLTSPEVDAVAERLRRCVVATSAPVLREAAAYLFRPRAAGKRVRPALALLTATAVSPVGGPSAADLTVDERAPSTPPDGRRRAQAVAEISETIHAASLLHDDVIDSATLRRGLAALNAVAGNKVSVLAGDFLLARAAVTLASIRSHTVTALMSSVIEDLVAGEIAQIAASGEDLLALGAYEDRCYLKTASLFAATARAAAHVSFPRDDSAARTAASDAAHEFGRRLGLAFQIVDDALDYESTSTLLGKPALADARAGLVTAPALLALPSSPSLEPLIRRKFKRPGDADAARDLVAAGGGCAAARALAARHAAAAVAALASLPPPATEDAVAARGALARLAEIVMSRHK